MGLLDELEQEAARLRGDAQEADAQREARERLWTEQLRPAMEQLGDYLKKLAQNLAFLKRRIRVTYLLPGYGEVVAYADGPFEVRDAAPGKHQHEIVFECVAQVAPEESAQTQADSAAKVRMINGVLQQHRLSGMQETGKNANGDVTAAKFQARGRIPLSVNIAASRDSGVARMQFVNIEAFGTTSRNFGAEQLTPDLFDSLGRYLMREDASFAREQIADDVRRQLQSQVQRDQVRRDWEQRLARQLIEDEARVVSLMSLGASPAALAGRLRLAIGRVFGKRRG
ncbi:hypothetical protein [Chiayiivirga flava]|uniref:Uncharacterized protein n=1 Tax=Chiayiivirga flava TaxID=659595 RepID=A0A7W8D674_9GAMM|nr:hypothetical protein [Chiayiivirga flava]MBB5208664.1 hypothetical protein [Chiayiivirga flava]